MQLGPTQEPKVLDGIQGRHEGVFVEAFPGRSNAQGQWVYRCSWGVSVLDNGTPPLGPHSGYPDVVWRTAHVKLTC